MSPLDAFVSCSQRTAGERADLSASERSDLSGRITVEIERLVKAGVSAEAVRKVEKNVNSSYRREGHGDAAQVKITEYCAGLATPKRNKKGAGAKAADASSRSKYDLRGAEFKAPTQLGDGNNQYNLFAGPRPRDLSDTGSQSALLERVPRGEKFKIQRTSDAESGHFAREVKDFLVKNGRVFVDEIIGLDATWMGVVIFTKDQVKRELGGDFYIIRIGADDGKRGPSPPVAAP